MKYSAEKMQKALGKKRWQKIADYDFSDGMTIDIMMKLPFTNPSYGTTVYVNQPDYNDMTFSETIADIKYFIDGCIADWNICPYNPDGTMKQ